MKKEFRIMFEGQAFNGDESVTDFIVSYLAGLEALSLGSGIELVVVSNQAAGPNGVAWVVAKALGIRTQYEKNFATRLIKGLDFLVVVSRKELGFRQDDLNLIKLAKQMNVKGLRKLTTAPAIVAPAEDPTWRSAKPVRKPRKPAAKPATPKGVAA